LHPGRRPPTSRSPRVGERGRGLGGVASRPSAADIEECNRYARSSQDKASEALKSAIVGGMIGAAVGAAGGAIADGGSGAGKGAGIGGIVGATAGTLHGIDRANRRDAEVSAAYRACMQRKGYN
jgi:hypothetical protein